MSHLPHSTRPYPECSQHPLRRLIPHGEIYCSLEFTIDPGEFVGDPSKVIKCFSKPVRLCVDSGVESDSDQAWGGGGWS